MGYAYINIYTLNIVTFSHRLQTLNENLFFLFAVAQQEQDRSQLLIIQQEQAAAEEEARRLEEERLRKLAAKKEHTIKKSDVKELKVEPVKRKIFLSSSLTDLHALRLRVEGAEGTLSQHVHICLGDDGMHDCGLKITELEVETLADTHVDMRQTSKSYCRVCVCVCLRCLHPDGAA